MESQGKAGTQQIIATPPHGLALRSSAIVARGLRDLARDSNWLIKKIFSARCSHLTISGSGQVCAVASLAPPGTERICLFDIELSVPVSMLAIPPDQSACASGLPAAFAYSPTARHLVAAWGAWPPELQVFDLQGRAFLGSFGEFSSFPESLAWSAGGKYLAVGTLGGGEARLRLWEAATESRFGLPFAGKPIAELTAPAKLDDLLGTQTPDEESDDEGTVAGFGRSAFSPDDGTLAAIVRIEGEWADDSLALFEVPTLRRQHAFQAQGRVTDVAWAFDGKQIIFCSAGQAYRLVADTMQPEPLPLGAELCACHPHLPLCLCFSSWLKNSAKGRLFLIDLERLTVFDECPAEGVVDLRWSLDGSKAYAVTADGLAYIYEPSLV
jgi:WD40 repeat protein